MFETKNKMLRHIIGDKIKMIVFDEFKKSSVKKCKEAISEEMFPSCYRDK